MPVLLITVYLVALMSENHLFLILTIDLTNFKTSNVILLQCALQITVIVCAKKQRY